MISISLKGRLGNQIFQYTICRLIAYINGYNFYIPEKGEPSTEGTHLKNFFENLNLGLKDGDIKFHIYEDISQQSYTPNIIKLPDYTHLDGFYQCPKYFEGYENLIRSWFTLTLNDESKNILEKYNINEYCYIHIRASDYKFHNHWYLKQDYYQKSMDFIKDKFPNISFVIITDDIDDSKELFPDVDCISSDMKTDFLLLLNSKYTIISNSTFSWWAAWLKEKEMVIAPNYWLNYNKPELGFYPVDIKTKEFIYL